MSFLKIAVFSDSHSNVRRMAEILEKNPSDLLIHLGDYISDAHKLSAAFPGLPVILVKGNNDFYHNEPETRTEKICNLTFFLTHGHRYPFSSEPLGLYEDALSKSADIALFGHTHFPFIKQKSGVLLLNPGSISLPRKGSRPTWARITLDGTTNIHAEIIEIS
ncbi:MAG: metallophosphoesterase [Bacillota bacterium]|nr:metallophosphoesterase [Bacillota bacterium]